MEATFIEYCPTSASCSHLVTEESLGQLLFVHKQLWPPPASSTHLDLTNSSWPTWDPALLRPWDLTGQLHGSPLLTTEYSPLSNSHIDRLFFLFALANALPHFAICLTVLYSAPFTPTLLHSPTFPLCFVSLSIYCVHISITHSLPIQPVKLYSLPLSITYIYSCFVQ